MYSLPLFGDGGVQKPAEPVTAKTGKPGKTAQGLFGSRCSKTSAPLPRPEEFGRC